MADIDDKTSGALPGDKMAENSPATSSGIGADDAFADNTLSKIARPAVDSKEKGNEEPTFAWATVKPSPFCPCFGIVLQLVLFAALGSFLFGLNISLLNTSVDAIMSEYRMCGSYNDLNCESLKWLKAVLLCSVMIGAAVGSMTGGQFLAFGRRVVYLVTMGIFLVGVISSCCANSYSAMLFARLLVGYAVGLVSVATPTYIAEVTPANKRGTYGVFHQLFIVIGILVGTLLGVPLTAPGDQTADWEPPIFQKFWWRFMLGVGILPVFLALELGLVRYAFETPHYYVEHRRFGDARELLKRLYNKDDVSTELNDIIDNVREGEILQQNGLTFTSAFRNPIYRHVILVGIALSAFQQFGGINVFMTSSNELFRKAGLDNTLRTVMTVVMSALNCVMTFPTLYLIERMGRRSLLLMGATLQFLSVVPAAIAYWTDPDSENPGQVTKILAIVG